VAIDRAGTAGTGRNTGYDVVSAFGGGAGGVGGVLGVGIDVVSVDRFARALGRTPMLAARLFTAPELVTPRGGARPAASLAARFAVKEAVAKALGVPRGMDWHDCVVVSADSGQPALRITGTVAAVCAGRGIRHWQISLSHDAGIAAAMVLALR
jgi:holo-[acyl-carrier protein] synthase